MDVKFAAAVIATLSAAPASAQQAPSAADQTRGMAIMGAVVSGAGVLATSSGAVSASRVGTGHYELVFERPVSTCILQGTSGHVFGANTGSTALVTTVFNNQDTTKFTIFTVNPMNLATSDATFHMLVFCPR